MNGPVHARIDPDVARRYQQIQRLVHHDAQQAYELARALPTFAHSDTVRLKTLAVSAHHSGQVYDAVKWYLKWAAVEPSTIEAFEARLIAAELMVMLGEAKRSETLLKSLAAKKSSLRGRFTRRRQLQARVMRMQHDLAAATQDKTKARGLATSLLLYLPAEPETRRPGLSVSPQDLNTAQRARRARSLYNAWSYKEARALFEPLAKISKYKDMATWHLSEIALNKLRDDPKTAQAGYAKLLGHSRYGAEARYQLARSYMRQERYAEALKHLDRYQTDHPNGSRIELVYYYRGWLPYDHRENARAIKGFEGYIKRYGRKGRKSSFVYGFRAWAYMRMGKWKPAIKAWEQMLPFGNPLVAGKAMYWRAYARHQLGDTKGALAGIDGLRKRWPLSYYGMHAEQLRAKIQGTSQKAQDLWWPEKSGTFSFEPRVKIEELPIGRLSPGRRRQWNQVVEFVQLGETKRARKALSPIYDAVLKLVPSKKKNEWVHALGVYVEDYHKMWRIGGRGTISYLSKLPPNNTLLPVMAYPKAYEGVVNDVAKEFNLPSYIIWSIMRQESRYKPSAISHTDAVGALQMIPKTARKVAKDLDITYDPRTFHFPEVGFRYSAFYMRKLLDTFEGLFTPMAGAYNSGPYVIAKWFKKNSDVPPVWLVEEFEYNEGRAYSRKVTEHMIRYVYLYESDPKRRARLLNKMFPISRDITIPKDVGY